MMRTFFAIVIIAFPLIEAADQMTCYVSYLRSNQINEELLSSVDSVSDLSTCTQTIDSSMTDLYQKLGLQGDNKVFEECFKKSVGQSGLKDAYLLSQAVKMYDVGWKLWKTSAKDKRVIELSHILSLGIKSVQDKCNDVASKESFRSFFDKVIYNRDYYRGDQEYCIRRHLVEKGIIGQFAYNMNINPQGVNENDADCIYILSSIENPTYSALQQTVSKCIVDFYRRNKYVGIHMKIEFVLSHLNLTPQEIKVERDQFTDTLFSIKENAAKHCNS